MRRLVAASEGKWEESRTKNKKFIVALITFLAALVIIHFIFYLKESPKIGSTNIGSNFLQMDEYNVKDFVYNKNLNNFLTRIAEESKQTDKKRNKNIRKNEDMEGNIIQSRMRTVKFVIAATFVVLWLGLTIANIILYVVVKFLKCKNLSIVLKSDRDAFVLEPS